MRQDCVHQLRLGLRRDQAASPEVECSVPVGLRASRTPHPPWLWRALLCAAAARAIATLSCSCRQALRSRRSLLRFAVEVPSHSTCIDNKSFLEGRTHRQGTPEENGWMRWLWWLWFGRDIYMRDSVVAHAKLHQFMDQLTDSLPWHCACAQGSK